MGNIYFCPRSGYKKCPRRGRGQKMAKFCPRSCWMAPKVKTEEEALGNFVAWSIVSKIVDSGARL